MYYCQLICDPTINYKISILQSLKDHLLQLNILQLKFENLLKESIVHLNSRIKSAKTLHLQTNLSTINQFHIIHTINSVYLRPKGLEFTLKQYAYQLT